MSKMRKLMLVLFVLAIPLCYFALSYGMERKLKGAEKYLEKEGCPNPVYVETNILFSTYTFSTDTGNVEVRLTREGIYQIVYD